MRKKGQYIYNREFKGGNVTILKKKDDPDIDFNGIISEREVNGKYEKDFYICDRVLSNVPMSIVRGEKCSAISCECDNKACDREDLCGRKYPVAVVEFEGMDTSKSMMAKTLKKNAFEYDRQVVNSAKLREFLRKKTL